MPTQKTLFAAPTDPGLYVPRPPGFFNPDQIILARPSRDHLPHLEKIIRLYPRARVVEQFNVPHHQIQIPGDSLLSRHHTGKKTLLFAELKTAIRFSQEKNNACPNYWHFSPYGFCPYGCHYCYLAGTLGVKFSPAVKIFLNLPDMLQKIDRLAARLAAPTAFYLGKLQDGLALDPLTGYSRIMIPFFARHPYARLILLTKSADVQNLLDLDHAGRTILSWSLNPPAVAAQFEQNTPAIDDRISAMQQAADAGYPVRAVIMPIIPVSDWREVYEAFLGHLLSTVHLQRLTLGGICSYPSARSLMNQKLTPRNPINRSMTEKSPDGRQRYPADLRIEIYSYLLKVIRRHQPDLPTALCLEQPSVRHALGMNDSTACCNCLL